MDEFTNARLREQERALRSVIARFSQVRHRAGGLSSGADWFGPASAAYDVGIDALQGELRAAHVRLEEALSDTTSAIETMTSATDGLESCG